MEKERDWAVEVQNKIRTKMKWSAEKNRNKIPYTTDVNGRYDDRSDENISWEENNGPNWWTNGFWPGLMWLMYQDTKEEVYKNNAEYGEERMEQCLEQFYGLHHDVGFMFQPSAVMNYRLTGNKRSKRTAMHAANLLAGRFNPAGNYIRAWNDMEEDTRGWAIIDCMLNLSLLYWASEESKDPRFKNIAMRHADTVMKNFVREDGSVCHIVEFDPESGERIRSLCGQGYAHGSAWTRGQGWALYGFVISYCHTGKKEYLQTAKKAADFCVDHIPENGIIPVDFCQPSLPAWEDSCGACVIASGLIELAKYTEGAEKARYMAAAMKILKTLEDSRVDWSNDCDAMVMNCSGAYHDKIHHITMSYADYYFAEAVYKLTDTGLFLW